MQYQDTLHNLTINAIPQPDGTYTINCTVYELKQLACAIKCLYQRRKYTKEYYHKKKGDSVPRASLGLSLNVIKQ